MTRLRSKAAAVAVSLMGMASVFALASPANAAAPSPTLKPAPVAPQLPAQLLQKSTTNVPNRNIQSLYAWTVSLSSTSTSLLPGQYATLTAHANQDVGPTPYWIRIHDNTSNQYIATCGGGTNCSANVMQSSAQTHTYTAFVGSSTTAYPPAPLQATSSNVSVTWRPFNVNVAASPTTQNIGGNSLITATSNADVGPTPYYIEVFDMTNGARLGYCGSGTTCAFNTSQSIATTHQFAAYISPYTTSIPSSGVQAVSGRSLVTWANTGYRVSLTAPAFTFGNSATATATSNINVGPTPYWIQIFNQNTGARIAVCGSGTTCSATFTPAIGGTNLVAFVSSYSTTYLPGNIQASSNVTRTSHLILAQQNIDLSASHLAASQVK